MKTGYKTTEFWVVAAVIVYALALALGLLKPSHITHAAENIQQGTEALPILINSVKGLADKYGELLVMGGLALAYMKRRSKEKRTAIESLSQQMAPLGNPLPPKVEIIEAVRSAIKEMVVAKKTHLQ